MKKTWKEILWELELLVHSDTILLDDKIFV
jgi:hypothetical protein